MDTYRLKVQPQAHIHFLMLELYFLKVPKSKCHPPQLILLLLLIKEMKTIGHHLSTQASDHFARLAH